MENILLAALFDKDKINRRIAVKKILDAMKLSKENISLRIFKVDWNSVDLTSPPLLQNLSEQDTLNAIELSLNNIYTASGKDCSLVSQVSSTVCDERHGQILNTHK